jgi:CDP-diacylglycerol--glycerol-3-phosphate 3-phosphatidyltransferase
MLLPFFLFARMAMNAIDGLLAREYKQQSKLGAVLNELTDVISDAALTMPFATLPGWDPLAVGAAIFFAALTEFAGLLGPLVGSARRNDGPFGKSDRAFALGALGVWISLGRPVHAVVPYVWILLCCLTVIQRARRALR